jgi:hypothetical protein
MPRENPTRTMARKEITLPPKIHAGCLHSVQQ